jgi:S-adenosylmethionine synthetase
MTRLFPAEFVLPGHPDKLCDAIADALVQEASAREKRALVGIEVAVHRDNVTVTGRIACQDASSIDVVSAVRDIYARAGYCEPDEGCEDPGWFPAPSNLKVSQDVCFGPLLDGEAEFRSVSDDQSIVTGYAVDLPGTNCLPPEQWLVSQIAGRLETLRVERPDLRLGPDGKAIVVLEQNADVHRLRTFSTSLQQAPGGNGVDLHRAVLDVLKDAGRAAASAIPGFDPALPAEVVVNGAGNFAVGGPEGDNGLSGKKLVVDAYGPRVPIGGGALSGKDLYKADRAGAILARRLAKLVVLTGAARECTATLALFPGDTEARIVSLRTGDGRELETCRWSRLLDLSFASVGDRFTGAENLVEVARHGHFTRERAWEALALA